MTFETLKNKYEKVKGKSKELDKFLKDNKSQFDGLGVSIKNAADAENLFNKGSDKFIESMKLRIKATALFNIAVQSLQEALIHDRNSKGWEHRLYHYQDYKDLTTGKKTDWKNQTQM